MMAARNLGRRVQSNPTRLRNLTIFLVYKDLPRRDSACLSNYRIFSLFFAGLLSGFPRDIAAVYEAIQDRMISGFRTSSGKRTGAL